MLATTRFLTIGFIFWMAAFQTPGASADPTETPAETPSATPTPSAPARPTATPFVVPGLLPNFKFTRTEATLAYDVWNYDVMATDPLTGDLYVLTPPVLSRFAGIRIYDARTFQLKESYQVDRLARSGWSKGNVPDMVFDREGVLYVCIQENDENRHWILKWPRGEREFQLYYQHESNSFNPLLSLRPIEGESLPIGVPKPGMLFLINELVPDRGTRAALYLIDGEAPTRSPLRIALFPDASYSEKFNRIVLGPDNRIYVTLNFSIYRLEADASLTELIGPNSHFKPRSYIDDLIYDSASQCFYVTSHGTLYRADPDFKQVLSMNDYDTPFPCRQIECSEITNTVFVAQGFNNRDVNEVYVLGSSAPYPTPTKTPTPPPPISTFRPTVFPTDPSGDPVALVPYVDLRLVGQTHPQIRSLAVHPITNDLYYHYYEYLPTSWAGGVSQSKLYSTFRGPIRTDGGFSPLIQQPIFGRYKGSLPFEKCPVVAPGDRIFMPEYQSVRLQKGDRKEELSITAYEMVFVGENCHFMDAPPGSILYYKWYSANGNPPYALGYFDPAEESPTARTLELSTATIEQLKKIYGGNWFFWGPGGKLHFKGNNSLYCFETDGTIQLVYERFNSSFLYYLPQDRAFYYLGIPANYPNTRILFRLPENSNASQAVLSFSLSTPFLGTVSADGDKLYLVNKNNQKVWEFEPHFTPGVPVATPTPTPPPGTPTPTPTPMDWMMLDGFGGIHVSRPEVQKPILPYFMGFDIARDLEPDPLGRGWYMLDGYGGIHLSSPDLLRPDNLPYFWQDDIARDLEILEKDGELTFVIMDGYGRLYVAGAHPNEVNMDAPLFGCNMARDLEPAPTGDGWLVMDAYGALFDSRDHTVSVAAGTYWLDAWFARDLSVFPDGATLMVDSYGGRHYAEGKSPLNRLYPIPSDLYFMGWEIIWDFEFLQ